jgi:hypothetical protein
MSIRRLSSLHLALQIPRLLKAHQHQTYQNNVSNLQPPEYSLFNRQYEPLRLLLLLQLRRMLLLRKPPARLRAAVMVVLTLPQSH